MHSGRLLTVLILILISVYLSCTDPLKEPPGSISGRIYLDPIPQDGEEWAYVRAFNDLADITVASDPATREFFIGNLPVGGVQINYELEVYRGGYITYRDTVLIIAGSSLVNYEVRLHQIPSGYAVFQDGISPDTSYRDCNDSYISVPDSNTVHGFEDLLIVSSSAPDSINRGLIHFAFNINDYFPAMDSTVIVVDSAFISLYLDSASVTGSVQAAMFSLDHFFMEDRANWIYYGSGVWPGGPGGSYGEPTSDTLTFDQNSSGWVDFSILGAAERWFIDLRRDGFLIKLIDENQGGSLYFRSSDSQPDSLRPRLYMKASYIAP